MYVLGINGWISDVHDASACLFKDSKLVGAVEEERFTRKKHAFDCLPWNCIQYLLNTEDIQPSDVETIIFGWDVKYLFKTRFHKVISDETIKKMVFKQFPNANLSAIKVEIVAHHTSHAAGAYYSSKYQSCNVFVLDGSGENESISIFTVENSRMHLKKKFPIKNSVGTMYEAMTEYIGFGTFSEGKSMGFTAFGKAKYIFPDPLKFNYSDIDHNPFHQYQNSKQRWKEIFFKTTKLPELKQNRSFNYSTYQTVYDSIPIEYADLAMSVQARLEKSIENLVHSVIQETGIHNICFTGGSSLNVMLNQNISKMSVVNDLFIQPAASDSGVCLGAALYYLNTIKKIPTRICDNQVFLGPKWDNAEIANILDRYHITAKYFGNSKELNGEVAKLLSKEKVVAVCRGKMEFGPRALGNRSILASPKNRDMKVRLNNLKNRESWRPFAPSTILNTKGHYFSELNSNKFMLMNSIIDLNYKEHVQAIVHEDGTTRAQKVSKEFNLLFYDLIAKFKKLTSIPMLVNTSFNVGNEPIVCSPTDALKTFFASDLDCLVLENFLIEKS